MRRVIDDRIELRDDKGRYHREDGPAVEWTAVEYSDGDRYWYQNGKRHRLDGPAIELRDGARSWYQNGKHHRLDGPAIEWSDGSKEWYLNGRAFETEQEWFEALTLEQQVAYLFKLGEK